MIVGVCTQYKNNVKNESDKDSIIAKAKNDSILQEQRFMKVSSAQNKEIGILNKQTEIDSLELNEDSVRFNVTLKSFENVLKKQNKSLDEIMKTNFQYEIATVDLSLEIPIEGRSAKAYYKRLYPINSFFDVVPYPKSVFEKYLLWRDNQGLNGETLPLSSDSLESDFSNVLSDIEIDLCFFCKENKAHKIPDLNLSCGTYLAEYKTDFFGDQPNIHKDFYLSSRNSFLVKISNIPIIMDSKSIYFTSLLDFNKSYINVYLKPRSKEIKPKILDLTMKAKDGRFLLIDSLNYHTIKDISVFSRKINAKWEYRRHDQN